MTCVELQAIASRPDSDAQRLAKMLSEASPSRTRGFAIAMHERMCAQGDEAGMALWEEIIAWLRDTGFSSVSLD